MSIIGGPVSIVIVALALIAGVVVWLARGQRAARSPRGADDYDTDDDGIDREELEAAEREVRDLDIGQRPEDGFEGDDWGPGAARPPR